MRGVAALPVVRSVILLMVVMVAVRCERCRRTMFPVVRSVILLMMVMVTVRCERCRRTMFPRRAVSHSSDGGYGGCPM